MRLTQRVRRILGQYNGSSPGIKANLARILMQGRLAGSGRMVILPVDQGFEHGPARSFAINPAAYDPHYHIRLAIDARLSAYAAPLGMIEAVADSFPGFPYILKMNSANSLSRERDAPNQAVTAEVRDALRLGCVAVGYTLYPGSDAAYDMLAQLREIAAEAKQAGLCVVVWSYPRGGGLSKDGETACDMVAYAAHIAALAGAHIIKVKPPGSHIEQKEARGIYADSGINLSSLADRVRHIVDEAAFAGRRLVVFSGGSAKNETELLDEIRAIRDGGAAGSIIGRNSFQRPRQEAISLLQRIRDIYVGGS